MLFRITDTIKLAPLCQAAQAVLSSDLQQGSQLVGQLRQLSEALVAALPASPPDSSEPLKALASDVHTSAWEAAGWLAILSTMPLVRGQPGQAAGAALAAEQEAAGWARLCMLPAMLRAVLAGSEAGAEESRAGASGRSSRAAWLSELWEAGWAWLLRMLPAMLRAALTGSGVGAGDSRAGTSRPGSRAARLSELWEALLSPLGFILPPARGAAGGSPHAAEHLLELLAGAEAMARHLPALLGLYTQWRQQGVRPSAFRPFGQLGPAALPSACTTFWILSLQLACSALQGAGIDRLSGSPAAALDATLGTDAACCRLVLWARTASPRQRRLRPLLTDWAELVDILTMPLTTVELLRQASRPDEQEVQGDAAAVLLSR
ncbi:hypothetical protein ABPG75_009359 [Micractinium tetrahymenae]